MLVFALGIFTACTDGDVKTPSLPVPGMHVQEHPVIHADTHDECGANALLVTDVCTQLGGGDQCVDVDDVCISYCDEVCDNGAARLAMHLEPTSPWPVAPDGYCIRCE